MARGSTCRLHRVTTYSQRHSRRSMSLLAASLIHDRRPSIERQTQTAGDKCPDSRTDSQSNQKICHRARVTEFRSEKPLVCPHPTRRRVAKTRDRRDSVHVRHERSPSRTAILQAGGSTSRVPRGPRMRRGRGKPGGSMPRQAHPAAQRHVSRFLVVFSVRGRARIRICHKTGCLASTDPS
jgi:hypothetical protein